MWTWYTTNLDSSPPPKEKILALILLEAKPTSIQTGVFRTAALGAGTWDRTAPSGDSQQAAVRSNLASPLDKCTSGPGLGALENFLLLFLLKC